MFYLFVVPGIISALYMGMRLYKMQKHDRVLYEFCELRRRLMRELRERGLELSREEYRSLRRLYDIVDEAIHDYSHYKIYVFNVRTLWKLAKRYNVSSQQMERMLIPRDEKLRAIYFDFGRAMINAFLCYTPFLRHEIFFRAAVRLLQGMRDRYINKGLNKAAKFFDRLSRDRQEYILAMDKNPYR